MFGRLNVILGSKATMARPCKAVSESVGKARHAEELLLAGKDLHGNFFQVISLVVSGLKAFT